MDSKIINQLNRLLGEAAVVLLRGLLHGTSGAVGTFGANPVWAFVSVFVVPLLFPEGAVSIGSRDDGGRVCDGDGGGWC